MDYVEQKNCKDRDSWSLNSKNKFVVGDLYLHMKASRLVGYRSIWKLKVPHKIKSFQRLMLKSSIMTKDNMLRRGWIRIDQCHFCCEKETINHLFLLWSC